MTIPRRLALAVLPLAFTVSACGDDGSEASPTADAGYAGICASIAAAAGGDKDAVTAIFDHGPLHELAEAATEADRAVAARLLEAKEQVESGMSDPDVSADELASALGELAAATRDAQQLTGDPVLTPCSEEP